MLVKLDYQNKWIQYNNVVKNKSFYDIVKYTEINWKFKF